MDEEHFAIRIFFDGLLSFPCPYLRLDTQPGRQTQRRGQRWNSTKQARGKTMSPNPVADMYEIESTIASQKRFLNLHQ